MLHIVLGTGATVINETNKMPSTLLESARLIFTVTPQGITLHVTWNKLKESFRDLLIETEQESGRQWIQVQSEIHRPRFPDQLLTDVPLYQLHIHRPCLFLFFPSSLRQNRDHFCHVDYWVPNAESSIWPTAEVKSIFTELLINTCWAEGMWMNKKGKCVPSGYVVSWISQDYFKSG